MGVIGRLLALVVTAFAATMIGSAIVARSMKERIVPVDDPDADEVTLVGIFGPIDFRSTASSFRGGTVECWFGGGTIDLREATLAPEGARLDVRAVFGGAQIVVPEHWHVTTRVDGIGGSGVARPAVEPAVDAPHLTIDGLAVFGGFGITSSLTGREPAASAEA